jgi:hypothetical protein
LAISNFDLLGEISYEFGYAERDELGAAKCYEFALQTL